MAHAVEHLKQHVKVDGFATGKAPASMVEDKLKPEALVNGSRRPRRAACLFRLY